MCIPAKIMAKIIITRLRDHVDAKLRREEAGFRPGRGTTEQTFKLQNIIEKSLEWNESLYTCFIGYEKAFNSIHLHEALWHAIQVYLTSKDALQGDKVQRVSGGPTD